ncbi:hypothetical protein ACFTUC_17435 [Streptomyces sp. NPDC056944]|uniref:hypothetical protein n=1 Tax=Streptomyces sp. NPDC056944 TaxID=3345972 RepID=UPI00363FE497
MLAMNAAARDPQPGTLAQDHDVAELAELIRIGGFWRLVPEEIPRVYAKPTRGLLEEARAGLERMLAHESR